VTFHPPDEFAVHFADGRVFRSRVAVFEMPVEMLQWETLAVAGAGKGIVVTDVAGEPLEIDAKSVRFYTDPDFAARVKAEHARVRLTRAELAEIAHHATAPSDSRPEGGFYRAAWK
jgi:hypothetical protein